MQRSQENLKHSWNSILPNCPQQSQKDSLSSLEQVLFNDEKARGGRYAANWLREHQVALKWSRLVARGFRQWRFQLLNHEERYIRYYMQRMQDQELITKRLNYEKRKMKVLTQLQMKMTKIKLRSYFTKYWCNVKYPWNHVDLSTPKNSTYKLSTRRNSFPKTGRPCYSKKPATRLKTNVLHWSFSFTRPHL